MTNQQLKESLNRIDKQALINGDDYFDFENLYEALKPLTNDEQKAINDAVRTKNPDTINATMNQIMIDRNPNLKAKVDHVVSVNEETDEALIIDDAEDLDEGRNNLKPVKCKAKVSGKPYYAPFDTKEKKFAEFGQRFRYETKEACKDAINDPTNELGYGKPEKIKLKGDTVDESIVNEKLYLHFNDDPEDTVTEFDRIRPAIVSALNDGRDAEIYVNNGDGREVLWTSDDEKQLNQRKIVSVSKDLEKDVLDMVKRPYKPSTGIPVRLWIALKAYKFSNNGTDTAKTISANDIRKAAGVPNHDGFQAAASQFQDLERDGLLYFFSSGDQDWVRVTDKLKPFIEGDNSFDDGKYTNIDFRVWEGNPVKDPELLGVRDEQGPTPKRSPKGRPNKEETPFETERKKGAKAETEPPKKVRRAKKFDLDKFESLDEEDLELRDLQEEVDEIDQKLVAEKKALYRELAGLDPDEDITEDNLDKFTYQHMCSMNGWPFEQTKNELLS